MPKPIPPKTKKLLDELKAWCDEPEGRGRRAEIARLTGVTRYAITHWFAGRQQPTAEQALTIQQFLTKQRRKRKESLRLQSKEKPADHSAGGHMDNETRASP